MQFNLPFQISQVNLNYKIWISLERIEDIEWGDGNNPDLKYVSLVTLINWNHLSGKNKIGRRKQHTGFKSIKEIDLCILIYGRNNILNTYIKYMKGIMIKLLMAESYFETYERKNN